MRFLLALTLAALVTGAGAGVALAADRFPAGFQWGVATSGFQTEMGLGANLDTASDWWAWTHDAAALDALQVTGDDPGHGPGFWSTYGADAALARRDLGASAFRLSLEWSRIFPRAPAGVRAGSPLTLDTLRRLDARANQSAVRHYRQILVAIRARHMAPFVTINHFTLPRWIHDPLNVRARLTGRDPNAPLPLMTRAGWLDRGTVGAFRAFSAYVAWKFGDLVDQWAPINEPMVLVTNSYVNAPGITAGNFPPGVFSFTAAITAVRNLARANAASYDAVKRWDTVDAGGDRRAATVGLVQNMIDFTPSNPAASQLTAVNHADYLFNTLLLDAAVKGLYDDNADGAIAPSERHPALAGKADFIGVNYYFRGRTVALEMPLTPLISVLDFLPTTTYRWALNRSAPQCPTTCSDLGSELSPRGLTGVLTSAASYGLPLYVTENGVADADDALRPKFLRDHLTVLQEAIAGGVDVRGYYAWSLTDNFEWGSGYTPKFGFYRVDRGTLRRSPRKQSIATFRLATRMNAVPIPTRATLPK